MATYLGPSAKGSIRFYGRSLIPKSTRAATSVISSSHGEGELDKPTTTPERQLPLEIKEGDTAAINIWVADDIESAKKEWRDAEAYPHPSLLLLLY